MQDWTPSSWRTKPISQAPGYPDGAALAEVERHLRGAAELVSSHEVRTLSAELAEVDAGRAFLLQGGDCAEDLERAPGEAVCGLLPLMAEVAAILSRGSGLPVVKVCRIAGQFAKPRSEAVETRGDVTLPSYRGDSVNAPAFDPSARTPDPRRLLRAYDHSSRSLEVLRAITRGAAVGGYGVHERDLRESMSTAVGPRLAALGRTGGNGRSAQLAAASRSGGSAWFISHEALLLPYEEALTRFDPETARWYSASAQMLWVGERTRLLDGAHLEFARGISNPIGLKCGPSLGPDELLRIIDTLNPSNELGRLTLIGRFGAGEVGEKLPCLMRAVQREGRNVIWSIDPMHGNTLKAGERKTRHFDAIVSEVEVFVEIARAEGAHPGGLHLELTGDHVSECSGGPSWPGVPLMAEFHQARCDPRLNAAQAVELALRLAEKAGIRPHRDALGSA